eukprot:12457596-Alexandrium_andersonii.AAC.1
MVELGSCGATWWEWIVALEAYASKYEACRLQDPDTNERYFGSNVIVVIDDAMNSFINSSWSCRQPDGSYLVMSRDTVIAGAPTH